MQPLELVQAGIRPTRDTSLLHSKLEWQVLDHWPAGGVYYSPQAAIGAFFPQLLSHFSHYEAVPEHYLVSAGWAADRLPASSQSAALREVL
jgi:hypothetical protein